MQLSLYSFKSGYSSKKSKSFKITSNLSVPGKLKSSLTPTRYVYGIEPIKKYYSVAIYYSKIMAHNLWVIFYALTSTFSSCFARSSKGSENTRCPCSKSSWCLTEWKTLHRSEMIFFPMVEWVLYHIELYDSWHMTHIIWNSRGDIGLFCKQSIVSFSFGYPVPHVRKLLGCYHKKNANKDREKTIHH